MSLTHRTVSMMLPVNDVGRAQQFYSESLGLDYTGTNEEGSAMYALEGGATLLLLPRPGGARSDSTAMSFEVEDLDKEIDELESRGVVFDDFDMPELKTVNHVAEMGNERASWFRDPDGNVICLHQTVA
jgi:predicted enzyme related to lactoylglutathione lyase